jgi:hypothetical protein
MITRRGNDWTKRFRKIANDAWNINAISGEQPIDLPAHFREAMMRLSPEQRRDHSAVNQAVGLADPACNGECWLPATVPKSKSVPSERPTAV